MANLARSAARADTRSLVVLDEVGYDVFLDDTEVIEVGRLRLHAIHNPGHTPGSISFALAEVARPAPTCALVKPKRRSRA